MNVVFCLSQDFNRKKSTFKTTSYWFGIDFCIHNSWIHRHIYRKSYSHVIQMFVEELFSQIINKNKWTWYLWTCWRTYLCAFAFAFALSNTNKKVLVHIESLWCIFDGGRFVIWGRQRSVLRVFIWETKLKARRDVQVIVGDNFKVTVIKR